VLIRLFHASAEPKPPQVDEECFQPVFTRRPIPIRHGTRLRNRNLGFERLEGRALLSMAGMQAPHVSGVALVARRHAPAIAAASPGKIAILNAMAGGAGHEFITLALREVRNINAVLRGFRSGAITQFTVAGMVFKIPNLQSGYTGLPHDPLSLTVGGGVLLKGRKIELAAVVRGPFTTYPGTTEIVFAINRGAGARLGPAFAGRPGITPDALVTVTVGPYGRSNSATITDLTTRTTQPLNPSAIQVAGPVVRLLVSTGQLPSEGLSVKKYEFAVWTEIQLDGGFQSVGSFAPEYAMIPIGVETNVRPPRV
jgi:hypothetical protein